MKKIIIILVAIFVVLGCTRKNEKESLHPTGTIAVDALRIRSNPTTDAEIVGKLFAGQKVKILAKSNFSEIDSKKDFWYQVSSGELIGWSFGGYINVNQNIKNSIKIVEIKIDDALSTDSTEKEDDKNDMEGFPSRDTLKKYGVRFYTFNQTIPVFEAEDTLTNSQPLAFEMIGIIAQSTIDTKLFYVVNEKFETGWAELELFASQLNEEYYGYIASSSDDSKIYNSYDSAKYKEYNLDKSNILIERIGPILNLEANGSKVSFLDGWTEYHSERYNVVGILSNKFVILHVQYFEGGKILLWDIEKDLEVASTFSMPKFSPDGKYFYTYGCRYVEPATLQIFKISDDSIEEVFNDVGYEGDPLEFRLIEAGWDTNNCVRILGHENGKGDVLITVSTGPAEKSWVKNIKVSLMDSEY